MELFFLCSLNLINEMMKLWHFDLFDELIFQSNKIVFEDRISEMKIKDLKATREGPRKILVILFEDPDGVAHVHVRDAMTALHIRTIVHLENVSCMDLRYSTLYLVRDGEIVVYNCCVSIYLVKRYTFEGFSK